MTETTIIEVKGFGIVVKTRSGLDMDFFDNNCAGDRVVNCASHSIEKRRHVTRNHQQWAYVLFGGIRKNSRDWLGFYSTEGVVYKRLHIFACDRLFADFCPYTSKFFVQPLMCVQNGKKSLKSSKIAKIVKNRKKWSKIAKIVKNRQKIAINRQKSLIIVEISNRNHRRELQWLSGIYHKHLNHKI